MKRFLSACVKWTSANGYVLKYGSIGFSVEHTQYFCFWTLSALTNLNFAPAVHGVLIVWFLLLIFANFIIEMNVFGGEIKNTLLLMLFVVNGRVICCFFWMFCIWHSFHRLHSKYLCYFLLQWWWWWYWVECTRYTVFLVFYFISSILVLCNLFDATKNKNCEK